MVKRSKLPKQAKKYSVLALLMVVTLASLVGVRIVWRSYAASPPPAGGYFPVSAITPAPAGTDGTKTTTFPTDAQCTAAVHGSTWEPRPENNTPNHTVAPQPNTLGNFSSWNSTWNSVYKPRIDGNFTGTTDEIIQWVACKWGWSDELVRAEAVAESNWYQSTAQNEGFGDYEALNSGDCVYDGLGNNSSGCPTSFSIIQVKWYFHPQGFASNSPQSSYPWITKSTAYALDLQVAEMRGCYDGMSTYLGSGAGATAGDLWGCIQDWYSGSWYPNGGNQSYSNSVKANLTSRPWASWPDQGGGDTTPPTVSISSPTGGTVSGNVNITANASDNVSVASVQFKVDGASLGSPDTASPYTATWNTAGTTNGTHTIAAVATDTSGNTTTSATITVTVANVTNKPGDINGDGSVNILDLSILAGHFGGSGGLAQGDLNGDGKINILDLSILASHWGS